MTYLTSWLVTMLTMFWVYISFCTYVHGAPTKNQEFSLLDSINQSSCSVFPPPKINLPPKCSDLTLLSNVTGNLYNKDSVEYFLCAGLLDSTKRLCHLAKVNSMFGERVKSQLKDSLPNIMEVKDNTFCAEMNNLDPKTEMKQAEFFYHQVTPLTCPTICFGLIDDVPIRVPICKLIHFAHQQIQTAIELQHRLNVQAENSNENPKGKKANSSDPQPLHVERPVSAAQSIDIPSTREKPQTVQGAVSNGKPKEDSATESQSASQPISQPDVNLVPATASKNTPSKAASATPTAKPDQTGRRNGSETKSGAEIKKNSNLDESTTSQKKSKIGQDNNNQPSGGDTQAVAPAVAQAQPGGQVQSDAEAEPRGENLGEVQAQAQPQGDALGEGQVDVAFDTQGSVQGEAQDGAQDGGLRDALGDVQGNAQGNAPGEASEDQVEEQNLPLTEDNDGINDSVRQDLEEDDGFDRQQQPNRDVAEKSGGKKAPETDVPLPVQQKISQELTGQLANFDDAEDSHFFAYFMSLSALCVLAYLVYHNKRKIIAMAVEGKKGRNSGRRRPNSASYHKLDSNLEEAMSSNLASTNSYVIY